MTRSIGEREGLITRIRQIRRAAAPTPSSPPTAKPDADSTAVRALEARIAQLEKLVEALQDSVHRDSERYGKRITELEARTQPAALGIALSKHARERGLS